MTIDPDAPGVAQFVPLRDRAAATTFAWMSPDLPSRVCRGRSADGVAIRLSPRNESLWMTGFRFVDGTMDELVEVSNGSACVRALDATGWWNLSPGYGAAAADDDERGSASIHLDARGGRLIGSIEGPTHAALTCSMGRAR